jgi:hypothetical protein
MFKLNNTFLAMLIVVYAFSFTVCSLNFIDIGGSAKNDQFPDIHCGTDLISYFVEDERNLFLIDLTQCGNLSPQDNEPHFPILSFAIFKVPKPA